MSDDELLKILERHGQQFLSSFDLPQSSGPRPTKKRRLSPSASAITHGALNSASDSHSDEDQEWHGFGAASVSGSEDTDEYDDDMSGSEIEDDDFRADSNTKTPVVTVFADTGLKANTSSTIPNKAQMKAFMSSKVTKLRQDIDTPSAQHAKNADDDADDELTNAQNDALLHRLVHTKLLSGSLNPDLDLKPAQRKKALAGRVLEAAGNAKLGKGERSVREAERNKASKRVREGLVRKQREKESAQLEEAKKLGNYHPSIKKLFDSSAPAAQPRKRERGLKMGVGKFSGGLREEVEGDLVDEDVEDVEVEEEDSMLLTSLHFLFHSFSSSA
ncbi:hypothetical protein HGRIS_009776 [Hohenbuehelia grisea]|uniref:Uncharacterized protein n=1 Tax=Hohenbuehelia grisea TaxID=104357 RepID=A0ABR3J2R3_9AGAR